MSDTMSYAELTESVYGLRQDIKALADKYDKMFLWFAEHLAKNTEAFQNLSGEVKTSRMECLNNCQMLADKINECQMMSLDGNGGNNGASQAPRFSAPGSAPTPSVPSGSQPKDSAELQAQGFSCPVGANVEVGAGVGVTQPQVISSRESLRQLVEAAEIHGARRKVASSTKPSSAGASRVSEPDFRSNTFDIQEIPTASVVTVCDNELGTCKEPAQSGSSNNLFFCPYCPRSFEYKHSKLQHIRSCKRNPEEEMKKLKAEQQAMNHQGVCKNLAVAGGISKKMNEKLKKKNSEGTATASENEDYCNAQQDRRIVPVPAANGVGPLYQEMGHSNDSSMPVLAMKYETNSNQTMVPDAVFPGTATLHSQFMTSSTYQCTTGGPTPVLREIKVETLRTASVPVHYPGVAPNFIFSKNEGKTPEIIDLT